MNNENPRESLATFPGFRRSVTTLRVRRLPWPRYSLITLLFLLALLAFVPIASANAPSEDAPTRSDPQSVALLQAKWDDITRKINDYSPSKGKPSRLEVFYVGRESSGSFPASSTECDYEMVIANLPASVMSLTLTKAMKNTHFVVDPRPLVYYHWALVFYDEEGQRMMTVNLDRFGVVAIVSGTRAYVVGDLYPWLQKNFAPWLASEYDVEKGLK